MARKEKQFRLVLADWKDVDELLSGIKAQLRKFGVVMQRWDVGTDETS